MTDFLGGLVSLAAAGFVLATPFLVVDRVGWFQHHGLLGVVLALTVDVALIGRADRWFDA